VEILVLHPGALGDIILSMPALSLLRKWTGQCTITLAANLDYLGVVPTPCADKCRSISTLPLQRLYDSQHPPESDVRFWNSFHRIISWTGFSSDLFKRNLRAIHPNVLVAPWKPARGEGRHVSRIFCDSLSPWVPGEESLSPVEIVPSCADQELADRWLAEKEFPPGAAPVALSPGSAGAGKRWSLENYAILGRRRLQERAGLILIIEGPAESGLGWELKRSIGASDALVAENLPLNLLLALLSRCIAYVGNDSGISHLAAAVGIPCAVVFGPTRPEQWRPLGAHVKVIRDVSGCGACEENQSDGHRCLRNVSPDAVWSALSPAL
jgi:hypothetical protein